MTLRTLLTLSACLLSTFVAAQAPCGVRSLARSAIQGLTVYAPDGKTFVTNKEDSNGIAQIYRGATGSTALTCITCTQQPNGPAAGRLKMQPRWHPSGRWLFLAVERDNYTVSPFVAWNEDMVEALLQTGAWTNMYAVSPDGSKWHRLTDFRSEAGYADGFAGPAFTPDGNTAVWSQLADGNILRYWPFGAWELIQADVSGTDDVPLLTNLRNITPAGMNWNEPGNFAPDNVSLLISGAFGRYAEGMDQYVLNIGTKALQNLTNSPTVWDEHGRFSPDGQQIIFMSAWPYRTEALSSHLLFLKTEFVLMNRDGSGLKQLTHFNNIWYPEFGFGIAANATWHPDGRSANLPRLIMPNFDYWDVTFVGACGQQP